MQSTMPVSGRRTDLDVLRGLASFAVCWLHLTSTYGSQSLSTLSGSLGWLGVPIFFVISGFVIPWSLFAAGFLLRHHYATFLGKRFLRIEPPYLVSIAICLVIWHLAAASPLYAGGAPPELLSIEVFAHLGYLNDLVGLPWLNLVYWTLAIEFQFYLFVGLAMPLMARRSDHAEAFMAALLLCSLVPVPSNFLSEQLGLFVAGIAAFRYKANLSGTHRCVGMIVCAAVCLAYTHGPLVAATAAATSGLIAKGFAWAPRILLFLGTISYSLHLVHVPIGGRVVNLGRRFIDGPWGEFALSVAGAIVSVGVAYALYRVVERPFKRASSRVAYRDSRLIDEPGAHVR